MKQQDQSFTIPPKLFHNSNMAHTVKLGETYSGGTERTYLTRPQLTIMCKLPLDPVYVDNIDDTEVLHYRAADMVAGKLYKFEWNGEHFAALKSKDGVEILKFYPDSDD